ncbi:MAG: hypothetical protein APF77_17320 [Clostridia bacterium BRH_c25]|nr:MAG: hypothetical protein APF77_17615 [Clostridia bacterium BRH_c25]KUO75938.1 MAG: hypothetical protein APF77_17320 [Clostridia bacterium BRH_c25]
MLNREYLIQNKEVAKDRAIGSLCGLAIGDSFGDAARKPDNQRDFGITTDFNKGASWSTDDTEFALLTVEMLINCGGNLKVGNVIDSWMKHVATEDELRRGGSSEVEAATNLRRGIMPPYSGEYNSYFCSDGAAMRSGPIGIMCAGDPERAAEIAAIDASISHYRDGIWGAQAVAVAVSLAMVDAEIDEILNGVLEVVPEDSWFHATLLRAFKIVDDAKGDIYTAWMPLHYDLFSTYRASVPEAVSQAFGVLKLANKSFREGVILAGNFGRDADTIGAIIGAVLGAKYGAKAIPDAWIQKTRYPSGTCLTFTKGIDIIDRATKLAELIR